MSDHMCEGASCRCNDPYKVGAIASSKKRTRKRRTVGPVTVKKADGSVEERPAYSPTKLRETVGHDWGEEHQYGKRAPRQTTVGRD